MERNNESWDEALAGHPDKPWIRRAEFVVGALLVGSVVSVWGIAALVYMVMDR